MRPCGWFKEAFFLRAGRGRTPRTRARVGSKPITELRLHGAACRTPNGHGAWSRGAWPIPCVRVRIDPYAHVKLSTLEDSEHSSAIMDGCEALLPTRQLFTHGLLSRLASLQLLLLGHRTLRTQACQPMSARPSEAKRGREQMSAAQVTSSSSSSSSFLPLAFLFTTAFWALLEPPPAPVGCETRVPNHVHQSAGGGSTVLGGSVYHRLSRAQAQSPITFLIKGATQGVRRARRARSAAQLAAGRPPALWGSEKACEVHLNLNLIPKSVLFRRPVDLKLVASWLVTRSW